MTTDRIGAIRACDPLSSVRLAYPAARDTLTPTEAPELNQAGQVVDLAPGERLLYVASWSDSTHVWMLSTTSPRFHTRRGLHVGSTFADVLRAGDSVDFTLPEGILVITLVAEGLSFLVDDSSSASFYRRYERAGFKSSARMMDSAARIMEFFAGQGCGK